MRSTQPYIVYDTRLHGRSNCVHDNRLPRARQMQTYKCKRTLSYNIRLNDPLVSGLTADATANPFSRDSHIPSFGTQKQGHYHSLSKAITHYWGVRRFIQHLSKMGAYTQFGIPCGVFLAGAFFSAKVDWNLKRCIFQGSACSTRAIRGGNKLYGRGLKSQYDANQSFFVFDDPKSQNM